MSSGHHHKHGDSHHGGTTLNDPAVPLNLPIAPFSDGRKVCITGVPTGGDRFSIKLMCGSGPDDDVGFLFDARFHYGESREKVVTNHKTKGKWGKEQIPVGFPLKEHEQFEMEIKSKGDSVKVSINGARYLKFAERLDLDKVNHLRVEGNIRLQYVRA